ncbi:hypothetical protein ACOME3_003067 [Neoechinorhynchus agilis]
MPSKKPREKKIANTSGVQKKNINPWGDASYADLITFAIECSAIQKLTLQQIYDWITTNIPYFGERTSLTLSRQWQNSVRHNLSLHKKFVRLPGPTGGRGSYWAIDEEAEAAEPTRNTRKRSYSEFLASAVQQGQQVAQQPVKLPNKQGVNQAPKVQTAPNQTVNVNTFIQPYVQEPEMPKYPGLVTVNCTKNKPGFLSGPVTIPIGALPFLNLENAHAVDILNHGFYPSSQTLSQAHTFSPDHPYNNFPPVRFVTLTDDDLSQMEQLKISSKFRHKTYVTDDGRKYSLLVPLQSEDFSEGVAECGAELEKPQEECGNA